MYLSTMTRGMNILHFFKSNSNHGSSNIDKTLAGSNRSHSIIKVKVNLINVMLKMG